jgi:hypothetical protein
MSFLFDNQILTLFQEGRAAPVICLTYQKGPIAIGDMLLNPYACFSRGEAEFQYKRHFHRPRFYMAVLRKRCQRLGDYFEVVSDEILIASENEPISKVLEKEPAQRSLF